MWLAKYYSYHFACLYCCIADSTYITPRIHDEHYAPRLMSCVSFGAIIFRVPPFAFYHDEVWLSHVWRLPTICFCCKACLNFMPEEEFWQHLICNRTERSLPWVCSCFHGWTQDMLNKDRQEIVCHVKGSCREISWCQGSWSWKRFASPDPSVTVEIGCNVSSL